MRLPAPHHGPAGIETIGGVAAVAALVALPTGLPLAEVVAGWLPALPPGTSGPLLVGAIWLGSFAWFWAGVRGWMDRASGLTR